MPVRPVFPVSPVAPAGAGIHQIAPSGRDSTLGPLRGGVCAHLWCPGSQCFPSALWLLQRKAPVRLKLKTLQTRSSLYRDSACVHGWLTCGALEAGVSCHSRAPCRGSSCQIVCVVSSRD